MPPSKVTLDDEVDDLDDVLEQFNAPPTRPAPVPLPSTSTSQAAPKSMGPTPAVITPEDIADEDAEFAKQFAAEMEAFMKGLATATDASSSSDSAAALADPEDLRKAWEKLLVEDLEADPTSSLEGILGVPGSSSGKAPASGPATTGDTFQHAVKQTMEKLKESDDTIKADETAGLASLLATLGLGEGGAGGEDGEGGVQGILETLMSQLMSKDILYEPLKELHQKARYLEENTSKLSSEDLERYKKQQAIVTEVVAIFEKPGYSDEDTKASTEIIRLMSEAYGSPPSEIMGPLPPGIEAGPDGLPALGEGCIIA